KGVGVHARTWAGSYPRRRAHQSDRSCECRNHCERRAVGCPRHRVANTGPQRQYQPRDRGSLRNFWACAAGRPLRRRRRPLQQPACPIGPSGDALRDSCDIRLARLSGSWRGDELRHQHYGCFSSGRRLHRPHSQGRKACGVAGGTVNQVRADHQPSDRSDARDYRAGQTARSRRRGDRVKRRKFITLLGGAAAWPISSEAQIPQKRPLIGLLTPGSKTTSGRFYDGFLRGMRERGYRERREYDLEERYADGNLARLPALAEELVHLRPDVIVAGTSVAVLAVMKIASSI